MPSGISVPLTIQIFDGDNLVRTENLSQDVIKIGKLSSSHVRLEDESVSRMHAVIEVTGPEEVHIIDLGSQKGTVVNGHKVNKSRIQSGDIVHIGDTKLVVLVGDPIAVEEAPAHAASTLMGMVPAPMVATSNGAAAAMAMPMNVPAPMAPPPRSQAFAPPQQQAQPQFDVSAVDAADGSRAIEVAAMFEEAVIDVRHFSNPQGGVITSTTRSLITVGVLSLVAALAIFVVASVKMAKFKGDWDAWDATGKPHNEFLASQPRTYNADLAMGIADLTAVLVGFGALLAGMVRRQREKQPRDFTIGSAAGVLFAAPRELLPTDNFPLVHSTGSDYELLFTDQMSGDVSSTIGPHKGTTESLADLVHSGRARASSTVGGAYAYPIPVGGRIKLDLGQNTFLVSSVVAPRYYPVPLQVNWAEQAYTIGSAAVAGLFLLIVFLLPPSARSLSLDGFLNDPRNAKFLIKPPEEKQEQIPDWLKKKSPDEAGGKGKRHAGEEGKMGKKESKNKAGLYAIKGPKDATPQLAKTLAEEQAKTAGVVGLLKANEGSHIASIFGKDSAIGNDAVNVLGGLVGTQIGEAHGEGGLGLVGTGRGGGGTGEGTIGLGGLGTIGRGGGGGTGSGYGRGAGGLGGRHARAPDVVPGNADVRGSLDKEIIRRIVRRHVNEVKFCYERELLKNAGLYGRVMIQFTIAGTGNVLSSVVQNSTMNNPAVEQCIAGAVRRWEFPKPLGGGLVQVSYPFVLRGAGGE